MLRVMKFGGTSVAGAARLLAVADRTEEALREGRVALVVSAMAGETDRLLGGLAAAVEGTDDGTAAAFQERHLEECALLEGALGVAGAGRLRAALQPVFDEVGAHLSGVRLLRACPPETRAAVASAGERACAIVLAAVLEARSLTCTALDPRHVLPCEGDPLEAQADVAGARERVRAWRESTGRLALMPGFYGGDASGRIVLLGRGGSDLSAALLAAALEADALDIWTDVAGVFTADPRWVPEALRLDALSYEEAMELAHFGAKVLHPRTLAPVRGPGIPVRVRHTFAPADPGTHILREAPPAPHLARGLTLLRDVSLLTLAGPGMPGVPGVAARAFGALASRGVNVVLITQASSECTLSVCVRAHDAGAAVASLAAEFRAEVLAHLVEPVERIDGLAVLSLVGDGMRARPGVAAALFGALGDLGCNVVAIAQGSSERSISAVVTETDGVRALPGVHARFFDTLLRVDVHLAGLGLVGRQWLSQLERSRARWRERGVEVRLCSIATSKRWASDPRGLAPDAAEDALARGGAWSVDALLAQVRERRPAVGVFVDCTSSDELADRYGDLVEAGLHVVAASKRLNSGPLARYRALREKLQRHRRRFHYETNVGAGLPVIGPLHDLLAGGDEVLRIEGILSGTLSFVYGLIEDGVPLTEAVRRAREAGFTEPDPRVDLSGLDVARKALVLARELGAPFELDDVVLESALPAGCGTEGTLDEWWERLPAFESAIAETVAAHAAEGRVLRFVAVVEPSGCRVGPVAVDRAHPLAAVRGGENAISITSAAYSPRPLVVRGYGAGAEVTAAGVLADVLRIATGGRS